MTAKVGFMQGRLSPIDGGRIQSFPWLHWREEIPRAKHIGLSVMEWTLDQCRLYENPLMNHEGRREIRRLMEKHDFSVPSLTGDCFMQAPFWKVKDVDLATSLKKDFDNIITSCSDIGIGLIVLPLVDNGRLEDVDQIRTLTDFLFEREAELNRLGVKIIFESDFNPKELMHFISVFNPTTFGINYDIGNSASLGFDPVEEFALFDSRILNVHVKDRLIGGTTCPLGKGDANFHRVFELLKNANYSSNYILQTARSETGDHSGVLLEYKNFVESGIA